MADTKQAPSRRNPDNSSKDLQGGSAQGRSQPSSPQLGEKSGEAMSPRERGGSASTEDRTDSKGGLGSAERSASQERSRGGQMGPDGQSR